MGLQDLMWGKEQVTWSHAVDTLVSQGVPFEFWGLATGSTVFHSYTTLHNRIYTGTLMLCVLSAYLILCVYGNKKIDH